MNGASYFIGRMHVVPNNTEYLLQQVRLLFLPPAFCESLVLRSPEKKGSLNYEAKTQLSNLRRRVPELNFPGGGI